MAVEAMKERPRRMAKVARTKWAVCRMRGGAVYQESGSTGGVGSKRRCVREGRWGEGGCIGVEVSAVKRVSSRRLAKPVAVSQEDGG